MARRGRQAPQVPRAYIILNECFVQSPTRHLWVKTHPCVAYVGCSHCGAKRFEPCVSKHGAISGQTHVDRRDAGRRAVREAKVSMVVAPGLELPIHDDTSAEESE